MSFNLRRLRAAAAAASVAALVASGAAVAAAPASADLVFYAPHFAKVENGSTISYSFVRKADDPKLDPSFEDVVKIEVGPKGAEDSVTINMFTGARALNFPNMSKTGNPVIVALLEQDVKEMNKALGGSPFYFRNRMREALNVDKPAEAVKVDYQGKSVDGWKVIIKPFADDGQNRGKLGAVADRTYELTFSDAVPGGLYELKAVTPKPDGGSFLTEQLTVSADGPALKAAEQSK